jgi:transcriptional regulator
MYVPEKYRAPSRELEHDLIERFNFGLLVGTLEGRTLGVHVPFNLDRQAGEMGSLRAHFALQNPLAQLADAAPVMVVFSGPHSYITPEDYVTPIHFPTWCYSSVHVYGRLRWLDGAELDAQLEELIATQEARFADRPPWTLARAPADLYQDFRKMITGFELVIDDLQGCFKLNQNKQTVDVRSLIDALHKRGGERNVLLAEDLERHNAARLAALAAEEKR